MINTMKSKSSKKGREWLGKEKVREAITCYLMLSPPLIGFFVLVLYPTLWVAKMSFYYYDMIPSATVFKGLENYIRIFTEEKVYWSLWGNTLTIGLIKIAIELPLALVLAYLISKCNKFSGLYRSILLLPNIISLAIVGLIFSNLFDYFGIMNNIFVKLNLTDMNINWFNNAWRARVVIIIATLWKSLGVNTLYFAAAISNVSEDLYEAAKIDGAGKFRTFFSITIPMIAPVFQTVLMLALVGSLQINDLVLVLTNGAPSGETFTVYSYLTRTFSPGFYDASQTPNIGYGSALSFVTAIIMGLIAFGYSKASDKLKKVY